MLHGEMMSKSRSSFLVLFGAASLLVAPLALPVLFQASAASGLTAADTDKDGTIDLNEAKAAAAAEFDKLDTDKDGTVDRKEAAHHISKKNFKAADPDNDKLLSKDEYVDLTTSLFKAADKDGDGTVDAKELHTKAGIKLDRVIE
jgi:Ca2+-binding EF-hand superfamily protein